MKKTVFCKENLQVPLTAYVYLEQTGGVYESGAGHLLIFRRCGPDLSGPDQTLQTSQQRNDWGLSRLSTCVVSVNLAITNHLTRFSRRNFSPHFPRECLKLEKLRTPRNTISHRCYFVQHPASSAPCPTTFLQGPSTLRHRILEFFQELHFLPGIHLTVDSYFPWAREEEPSISSQEDDSICLGIPMRCFTVAFHKLIIVKAPLGSGGWKGSSFGKDLHWHESRTAQTSQGNKLFKYQQSTFPNGCAHTIHLVLNFTPCSERVLKELNCSRQRPKAFLSKCSRWKLQNFTA